MRYLDPVADAGGEQPRQAKAAKPAALPSLAGKVVALINNSNASMVKIHGRVATRLREAHGIAGVRLYEVPRNFAPPAGALEQIAGECDAAIFGLAN